MKLKIALLGLLVLSQLNLFAQQEFLDSTFNSKGTPRGRVVYNSPAGHGEAYITVDNDGRSVVVACSSNTIYSYGLILYRLLPNGKFDKPFGGTDSVSYISLASPGAYGASHSIAIQGDNKILVGGQIYSSTGSWDMFVFRLNEDGTLDTTFGNSGFWIKDISGANSTDIVNNIKVQKDGRIVVSGTTDNKIFVTRLMLNGQDDGSFKDFRSSNAISETNTGLALYNDTIYTCGNYYDSSYVHVALVKLSPNGDSINNPSDFWKSGRIKIKRTLGDNSADLIVQPNGKILIGGYSYADYTALRINSNGSIDTPFGTSGTGTLAIPANGSMANLASILYDKSGYITLVGTFSGGGHQIVRINGNGAYDNLFGVNGRVNLYYGVTTIPNQAVVSKDNKLLIAAEEGSSSSVEKILLRPPVHIIGNNYVLPGTVEKYSVDVPATWSSYTYTWSYSEPNGFVVSGNGTKNVSVFFSDTVKAGILTCRVFTTAPLTLVALMEEEILVNTTATDVNQLAELQCKPQVIECQSTYISGFNFNLINNDTSNACSDGYFDYTQSPYIDSLIIGGVYSATVKVESDQELRYVGMWIDYNNDGSFNDSDEFIAETYSTNSEIKLRNIILKNEVNYNGPKRLRIRTRVDSSFSSNESCQQPGEVGETEDYYVYVIHKENLEAPQIITPNDDGKNDYFVIRGIDPSLSNTLTIYDRLGEIKYQASGYKNNWSGIDTEGEKLTPGTYFYLFSNGNSDRSIKGFLEVRY